jgi:hypothetical protein
VTRRIALLALLAVSGGSYGQNSAVAVPEQPPAAVADPAAGNRRSAPKPKFEANPDDLYRPASLQPRRFVRNLTLDQKDIWSGPAQLRVRDLNWLMPMIGLVGGSITADTELSSRISPTGTFGSKGSLVSNAGVAAAIGGSGLLYLMGRRSGDEHKQETGILAGEAAINAALLSESFKFIFQRERPDSGSGRGRFFAGSPLNSSFPSLHSAVAWSVAGVLAHEYPGPLTQVFAYGLASAVSFGRVAEHGHYPTDVIVGAALGWYTARQVYARHHDRQLDGAAWGTFHRSNEEEPRSTESVASPYVPLESWVYSAFDRLEALGLATSGIQGMKPWTRRECARLLEEAADAVENGTAAPEAARIYKQLTREFAPELNGAENAYLSLDSIYVRSTSIAGRPLTDSYHFAQTVVNDYGRPYQQGWNGLAGFSTSSSLGPFGFVVRGEYEHAPGAPGYSQPVLKSILFADNKPLGQIAAPVRTIDQFRLIDAYVMLNLKDLQFSFGKQSLWLGPTRDPFLFSNNAEPIYMFRIDQVSPRKLPSWMSFLGPYRFEVFVGKLTGQHYVNTQDPALGIVSSLGRSLQRQPMINGQKISFKPTPNFEFSVGRTGLFGGPDFPITLGSVKTAVFSTTNTVGRGHDPGDRRSTFDFSYRLPGLRKWLVLYNDSFVEDEISPIGYPRRAAQNSGLYMPQMPGIPKLDLRVEGGYTNLPELVQPLQICGCAAGGFFYWNTRYLDGYTNQGQIMGDATLGRQGIGYRGAATYWFASDRTVQVEYRQVNVDQEFLQGGDVRDFTVNSQWRLARNTALTAMLQYERWNFPLLDAGNRQHNFTASFQLTYFPHWKLTGK